MVLMSVTTCPSRVDGGYNNLLGWSAADRVKKYSEIQSRGIKYLGSFTPGCRMRG